ncbi:MAG TPA: hypothetical protein VHB79_34250 [Polyangiaceae bacterium]|nr:hypothetical protein [Polyangiaceae bacterium]
MRPLHLLTFVTVTLLGCSSAASSDSGSNGSSGSPNGGSSTTSQKICESYEKSSCDCPGGVQGEHFCNGNGDGYDTCICPDPLGPIDPQKVLCTEVTPGVECQCVRGAREKEMGIATCDAKSFGGALCFTQPKATQPRCRCMEWKCVDDDDRCDCGASYEKESLPDSCKTSFPIYCYDPENESCLGWDNTPSGTVKTCNAGEIEVPSCDGSYILPMIKPHRLKDLSNPNGYGIADCVAEAANLPDPPQPMMMGGGGSSGSGGSSSGGGMCDPSICNGIDQTCSDGFCITCESSCQNGECKTDCF